MKTVKFLLALKVLFGESYKKAKESSEGTVRISKELLLELETQCGEALEEIEQVAKTVAAGRGQ